MKLGLLADIHANAHALEAVLKSAREKNVEKLLCCGDYVGYYYEPDKCIELLGDWDWIGVCGNHETMFLDWINDRNRNEIIIKYGSGISIAAEKLTHKATLELFEKPEVAKLNIDNYKVMLCHGSPWGRDIYIYPDADQETVNKLFRHDPDVDVLVYGHTHHPVFWEQDNKKIINPGSVGQPRDREPGASWALWDSKTNDVEFYRERYDISPIIEMCKQHDLELNYLIDVLVRK